MLRSNALIVAMKGVTFIPLAALIYFSDYQAWVNYLVSTNAAGFFVAALALFGFGVWLKREIVETYVQASKSSIVLGFISLVAAISLYLYGSFYQFEPVMHFESLVLLAISYLLFRTDARLVRLVAPLFVIVGFAFSSSLVIRGLSYALRFVHSLNSLSHVISPLVVGILMMAAFASYTNPIYLAKNLRTLISNSVLKTLILPAVMIGLALGYWFLPFWALGLLIPAPLLVLVSKNLQNSFGLPRLSFLFRCARHTESGKEDGFCVVCGRRFGEFRRMPGSGLLGLAVIVLIVAALLLTQIPLLWLSSGIPFGGEYSISNVSGTQLPSTSSGWLLNSSTPLNYSQDVYAVRQVYVPAYHPETKNYTLYYELSASKPYFETNSWGTLPGWSRTSQSFSLEGLGGALVTYKSNSSVMMVFAGSGALNFFANGSFQRLRTGMSVVRVFSSSNATSASSQFVSDLGPAFGPSLGLQADSSGWTDFLQKVIQTADQLGSLMIVGITSIGIALCAYFAQDYDSKLDSFLIRSSELDDQKWQLLSAMVGRNPLGSTTVEISRIIYPRIVDPSELVEFAGMLQTLEKKRLVKRAYSERMGQLFLTWKESMQS